MQDYTEYLKSLAETQKQTKAQELEMAKQQALTTVEQEKARVMPTFQAQRQQASTQSQLGAKNFAEYLASRGQTGAGISAQAEMSRQNALAGQIGTIGQNEAQTAQQFANQVGNIGQQYQAGLQSAYGNIDINLAENLYNEKQRQDEIGGGSTKSSGGGGGGGTSGTIKGAVGQWAPIESAVGDGKGNVIYTVNGQKYQVKAGYNPYTGTKNPNTTYGTFSNGYQPNNTGKISNMVNKLVSSGKKISLHGMEQNVWKGTIDNKYYFWDGAQNKYISLNAQEKKALGLK